MISDMYKFCNAINMTGMVIEKYLRVYMQIISTKWIEFEGIANFTMNYNNVLNKQQINN